MGKNNVIMEQKFNELSFEKKMEVLGVTEDTFKLTRFKGIDKNIVVNDIWNGRTNSEKRAIMKNV